MKHYVLQVLIALDQFFNALFGGWADETLSSRAYRAEQRGKIMGRIWRPVIDALFFFDPEHCYKSHLAEIRRNQSPEPHRMA